jgi:hypothetical protein
MNELRNKLNSRAASMVREEEFEIDGDKFLAIGLMSGGKNRVMNECFDLQSGAIRDYARFVNLVIALCIYDPSTRKPLFNASSQEDRDAIDALPSEITEAMVSPASRVCGWGKEAVTSGKTGSEPPNTSSGTSSPPASAAASKK